MHTVRIRILYSYAHHAYAYFFAKHLPPLQNTKLHGFKSFVSLIWKHAVQFQLKHYILHGVTSYIMASYKM